MDPGIGVSDLGSGSSIFSMFWDADPVVKVVLLILIVFSAISWSIILEKFFLFRKQLRMAGEFERAMMSGEVVEDLYDRFKERLDGYMVRVFLSGVNEFKSPACVPSGEEIGPSVDDILREKKQLIHDAMDVETARVCGTVLKRLSTLSIIASTAPFLGLFGTVWGIMTSFRAIAAMKDVSLSVVAPSLSEALFATAFGLIAAIPASFFYNRFLLMGQEFAQRLDIFVSEFSAFLSKHVR